MYLFLFTVIPLGYFLYHELEKKRYAVRGAGFNFFCGSITSVLYCFVGFLVFSSYRVPEFNFRDNFVYFFLTGTIYPVSCCVLLYLLLGKNDWKFKLLMFSDVVPSFYAVFLPYRIISVYDITDAFSIFVLPVVVASCLYILRKAAVYVAVIKVALWKKIVFGLLAAGLFLVMPALTETMYYVASPLWLRCVAEIGIVLLAVGSYFLFKGEVSFEGVFPAVWKRQEKMPGEEKDAKPSEAKRTKKAKKEKAVKAEAEVAPEGENAPAEKPRETDKTEKVENADVPPAVEKEEPAPANNAEPAEKNAPKAPAASKTKKGGKKSSGSKKKK
ncbi:MAG: hypothetical protein J5647_12015 [Spirochaetaceae bacterium]|nr:hypothetical protein [Spirochaetaceae bacterium]